MSNGLSIGCWQIKGDPMMGCLAARSRGVMVSSFGRRMLRLNGDESELERDSKDWLSWACSTDWKKSQ